MLTATAHVNDACLDDTPMLHWIAAGVLAEGGLDLPGGYPLLATWSGAGLAEDFARRPAAWLPGGMAQLQAACDALAPELERKNCRLLLRPHARQVLSDAPSCAAFLAARPGRRFGLLLDPWSMLEDSMYLRAAEHLQRIFVMLGPLADAVLLSPLSWPPPNHAATTEAAAALVDEAGRLAQQHCRDDVIAVIEK